MGGSDGFGLRNSDPIAGGEAGGDAYVTSWKVGPAAPSSRQFKTLWFDDDLDGDFLVPDKPKSTDKAVPWMLKGANDLYGADGDGEGGEPMDNVRRIWQSIVDEDNDPTLGDFGKVDLAGDDPDTDAVETDVPDGEADNMTGYQADNNECSMGDNGDDQEEACDAMFEETFPVYFTDGTFGCETTVDVTVTCEWDSQGGLGDPDPATTEFTARADAEGNIANFANCTAEMN